MRVAHLRLTAGLLWGLLGCDGLAHANSMIVTIYPQIGDPYIWVDTFGPDRLQDAHGPHRLTQSGVPAMDLLNSSGGLYWTYTEFGHVASTGPITVRQYQSSQGRYRVAAGGDYSFSGGGSNSYALQLDGSGTILSVSGLPYGSSITGYSTSTIGGAVSADFLGFTVSPSPSFWGIQLAGISSTGSLSLGNTGGNITATGNIDGNISIGNYTGKISAASIGADAIIQLASGSATISAPTISGVIRVTSNFTGTIEANGLTPETIPVNWSISPSCGWYVKDLSTGVTEQIECLNFDITGDPVAVPEGSSATFTVALNAEPSSPVEVTVIRAGGDPDITVVSPSTPFTLDETNWQTGQVVRLEAAFDADADNGEAVIEVGASNVPSHFVTAIEDDSNVGVVFDGDPVHVPQGGTAQFHVWLSRQPSSNVEVTIQPAVGGDPDITVQSGGSLTFTTTNYATPAGGRGTAQPI